MDKPAIIPFGKYKGQPLDVLTQDEAYLEWLTAQDWFKSKYQNLYTIIINNYHAPTETPEHNRLQAKFLDGDYGQAVIEMLDPPRKTLVVYRGEKIEGVFELETYGAEMEQDGMDVEIEYARVMSMGDTWVYDDVSYVAYLELKPSLGDDYPAVLRQITSSTAYRRGVRVKTAAQDRNGYDVTIQRFALIVGTFASEAITAAQLRLYFERSFISVIFEQDLDARKAIVAARQSEVPQA